MNNANFYFSLHQHVTVINQVKLLITHHLLTFYWFIFSLFTLLLCLMLCLRCPVLCKRAALQNIQGHSFEWNTPLYIYYVDFKKAFGSVYRNTRGKTLHYDGIPPKIITINKIFHKRFECSVLMDNTLTDWFSVQCWVRQGCTVSLTLFLLTTDWITTKTAADKPRGIQWTVVSARRPWLCRLFLLDSQ